MDIQRTTTVDRTARLVQHFGNSGCTHRGQVSPQGV